MDPQNPDLLGAIFSVSQMLQFSLALAVGGRLLWLARRTRLLPEFLVGLSFLCGSGFGFAILVSGMIALSVPGAVQADALRLVGIGYGMLDVGVLAGLGFTYVVYRRRTVVGRGLLGLLAFLLIGTYSGLGLAEGFLPTNGMSLTWYWAHYGAMGLCSVWGAFEAFRYYRMLGKRLALGLADPVVRNRFLLWGSASVAGLGILALAALPSIFPAPQSPAIQTMLQASLIAMTLLAMGSLVAFWLTFFPTQAYLRWVQRRADGAATE